MDDPPRTPLPHFWAKLISERYGLGVERRDKKHVHGRPGEINRVYYWTPPGGLGSADDADAERRLVLLLHDAFDDDWKQGRLQWLLIDLSKIPPMTDDKRAQPIPSLSRKYGPLHTNAYRFKLTLGKLEDYVHEVDEETFCNQERLKDVDEPFPDGWNFQFTPTLLLNPRRWTDEPFPRWPKIRDGGDLTDKAMIIFGNESIQIYHGSREDLQMVHDVTSSPAAGSVEEQINQRIIDDSINGTQMADQGQIATSQIPQRLTKGQSELERNLSRWHTRCADLGVNPSSKYTGIRNQVSRNVFGHSKRKREILWAFYLPPDRGNFALVPVYFLEGTTWWLRLSFQDAASNKETMDDLEEFCRLVNYFPWNGLLNKTGGTNSSSHITACQSHEVSDCLLNTWRNFPLADIVWEHDSPFVGTLQNVSWEPGKDIKQALGRFKPERWTTMPDFSKKSSRLAVPDFPPEWKSWCEEQGVEIKAKTVYERYSREARNPKVWTCYLPSRVGSFRLVPAVLDGSLSEPKKIWWLRVSFDAFASKSDDPEQAFIAFCQSLDYIPWRHGSKVSPIPMCSSHEVSDTLLVKWVHAARWKDEDWRQNSRSLSQEDEGEVMTVLADAKANDTSTSESRKQRRTYNEVFKPKRWSKNPFLSEDCPVVVDCQIQNSDHESGEKIDNMAKDSPIGRNEEKSGHKSGEEIDQIANDGSISSEEEGLDTEEDGENDEAANDGVSVADSDFTNFSLDDVSRKGYGAVPTIAELGKFGNSSQPHAAYEIMQVLSSAEKSRMHVSVSFPYDLRKIFRRTRDETLRLRTLFVPLFLREEVHEKDRIRVMSWREFMSNSLDSLLRDASGEHGFVSVMADCCKWIQEVAQLSRYQASGEDEIEIRPKDSSGLRETFKFFVKNSKWDERQARLSLEGTPAEISRILEPFLWLFSSFNKPTRSEGRSHEPVTSSLIVLPDEDKVSEYGTTNPLPEKRFILKYGKRSDYESGDTRFTAVQPNLLLNMIEMAMGVPNRFRKNPATEGEELKAKEEAYKVLGRKVFLEHEIPKDENIDKLTVSFTFSWEALAGLLGPNCGRPTIHQNGHTTFFLWTGKRALIPQKTQSPRVTEEYPEGLYHWLFVSYHDIDQDDIDQDSINRGSTERDKIRGWVRDQFIPTIETDIISWEEIAPKAEHVVEVVLDPMNFVERAERRIGKQRA